MKKNKLLVVPVFLLRLLMLPMILLMLLSTATLQLAINDSKWEDWWDHNEVILGLLPWKF